MIERLTWRYRFTSHGQRKTGWGWLAWWQLSGSEIETWTDPPCGLNDPHDSAEETIFAANLRSA